MQTLVTHTPDPQSLVVWVFASEIEAKPFVEACKAKKQHSKPYSVYAGDYKSSTDNSFSRHVVIISGLGSLNAALATAWLAGHLKHSAVWINVGVAGHARQALGSLSWISSVRGPLLAKPFYPIAIVKSSWPRVGLETLESPSAQYAEYALDMEASGFVSAALQFSSREFVQIIKVISDNEQTPFTQFSPSHCYAVLKPHVASMLDYANTLLNLKMQTVVPKPNSLDLPFRASHSQQRIVNELVYKVQLAGHWDNELQQTLDGHRSARAAIDWLHQLVAPLAPKF